MDVVEFFHRVAVAIGVAGIGFACLGFWIGGRLKDKRAKSLSAKKTAGEPKPSFQASPGTVPDYVTMVSGGEFKSFVRNVEVQRFLCRSTPGVAKNSVVEATAIAAAALAAASKTADELGSHKRHSTASRNPLHPPGFRKPA